MKYIASKYWLCLGMLLSPLVVQAVGVSQSGIDLSTSTIEVTYTMTTPDDHTSFLCFGQSTALTANTASIVRPLSTISAALGGSQIDISIIADNSNPVNCFQQAGNYDVTINLVDYVGNTTTQTFSLQVAAQEATADNTQIIASDCAEAFANNHDECQLTVTLRDQFNNVLKGLSGANVLLRSAVDTDPWSNIALNCQDTSGSGNDCQSDANLGTRFFDALRIKENSSFAEIFKPSDPDYHTYALNSSGKTSIDFKALAPSLADNGKNWQEEVTRYLPVELQGPALDTTGAVTSGSVALGNTQYAPLTFRIPLQLNINVDIGHKPDGNTFVTLQDINDYQNQNERPPNRYLIPCSAQRSTNFDLETYGGEDTDDDGNIDPEYTWYQGSTQAQSSDLALCPTFELENYEYLGSDYNNEGQYARIQLLQNNTLRSAAKTQSSCNGGLATQDVCMYDSGSSDADGVPTSLGLEGFLVRTDTISFNNENPSLGNNNNLNATSNTTPIFVPATEYDDILMFPSGNGLNFYGADTVDPDPAVDDFQTVSVVDKGTKTDLKAGSSNGNYQYTWRYFDEDADPEFQLKTVLEYVITEGSSAVPVAYYAGEYGLGSESCEEALFRYNVNCSSFAADDPEYDILVTGDIVGDFFTYTDSTNLTDIGNVTTGGDLREEITKNAFVLSREIPTQYFTSNTNVTYTDTQSDAFAAKFSSSGVYVVENGNLKLGNGISQFALPAGKNTVIIKDGNLIIDSNLAYRNQTDSFGVIVICSDPKPYPTDCGNILVKPSVQRIVGTIFGDGGIMTSNADYIVGATINDEDYDNQLVISGTLLTRNTIGGFQNVQSFYTPWETYQKTAPNYFGNNPNQLLAANYDLRMLRQPDRNIQTAAQQPIGSVNNAVVSINAETRKNSVIIESDIGRTTQLTPPGFEVFGNIGR